MAKWENSPKDRALDRKGAKKAGVSLKSWEGSAADKRVDSKAIKKMAKRGK